MPLLEVSDLRVSYGKALAIESVSITVEKGELIGVLGPNGAGKTTLLKAISRSIGSQGTLKFKDQTLDGVAPYDVVARGICHCPEGRKLFSELSVLKNLQLGAYLRSNKAEINADLERVFTLFPVLRERQWQQSSTLSGGEQQMVAIGRALMGRPELLLLDEPSVGIAPRLKGLIFNFDPADQERRHRDPDRGAGRDLDAQDHGPRLCARTRPHHPRGHGQGNRWRQVHPAGLSGRVRLTTEARSEYQLVMAGLVPAIHVYLPNQLPRRGCPGQARA